MFTSKQLVEIVVAGSCLVDQFNCDMGWYAGRSDNDSQVVWNHWSGAWAELDLPKTTEDVRKWILTIFSLSLCYGPMPALTDDQRNKIIPKIWPNGNGSGCAASPCFVIWVLLNPEN